MKICTNFIDIVIFKLYFFETDNKYILKLHFILKMNLTWIKVDIEIIK